MYLEDVEQSDEKKKDYMFYAIKDFQFVRSGVDNIPLKWKLWLVVIYHMSLLTKFGGLNIYN